ncbi:MAG: AMP-binding protein, partial [Hyphomicrobiales bacterium]
MPVSLVNFVQKSARLHPDLPAVTCEGRTRTWKEVWQRVQSLAGGLQSLGLQRGERIAYLGFNTDWFFECYFAPSLTGLELVALNYRLALPELVDCLNDCSPAALICDADHARIAQEAVESCPSIKHLIAIGGEDGSIDAVSYEALLAEDHTPEGAATSGDDTLIIYYTGGTTGRAKGVMLSHWNLFSNSMGTIPNYGLKPLENYLLAGPMFHSAAGSRVYTTAILATHMILLPKFDVPAFLGLIEEHKVRATQCVPTMMQMILDHDAFGNFDISSLKMITWGAAPTPDDLLRRIIKTFPDAELFHGYGMTEASPLVTALGPEFHNSDAEAHGKLGSAGKPLSHV